MSYFNNINSFFKKVINTAKNSASNNNQKANNTNQQNQKLNGKIEEPRVAKLYGIVEPEESMPRLVYGIVEPEESTPRLVYGIVEPEEPMPRLVYGIIEPEPTIDIVYGMQMPEKDNPSQKAAKNAITKLVSKMKDIFSTIKSFAANSSNKDNKIINNHSLLSEYNKLVPAKNSGYVTTNEQKKTRAFYDKNGNNTTNLAALKFTFPNDGPTRATALFNGKTSRGNIVAGRLDINYDTGEGTLDGKKIKFNTETGIITFENKNDEAKATKGNTGANKALKTGSSSIRTAKDSTGKDIKIIEGIDNSFIVYNSKGDRIAQVEQTKAIKGNSKSFSGLYTGYDSKNREITGTLVYDASAKTYTLDGKKCTLNKDTGRITFIK